MADKYADFLAAFDSKETGGNGDGKLTVDELGKFGEILKERGILIDEGNDKNITDFEHISLASALFASARFKGGKDNLIHDNYRISNGTLKDYEENGVKDSGFLGSNKEVTKEIFDDAYQKMHFLLGTGKVHLTGDTNLR